MNICERLNFDENIFNKQEKLPDLIKEKLYIGDIIDAGDKETLMNLGITHILIFASYIEPQFPNDFTYKKIQVHDLPDFKIKDYLEECFR